MKNHTSKNRYNLFLLKTNTPEETRHRDRQRLFIWECASEYEERALGFLSPSPGKYWSSQWAQKNLQIPLRTANIKLTVIRKMKPEFPLFEGSLHRVVHAIREPSQNSFTTH